MLKTIRIITVKTIHSKILSYCRYHTCCYSPYRFFPNDECYQVLHTGSRFWHSTFFKNLCPVSTNVSYSPNPRPLSWMIMLTSTYGKIPKKYRMHNTEHILTEQTQSHCILSPLRVDLCTTIKRSPGTFHALHQTRSISQCFQRSRHSYLSS